MASPIRSLLAFEEAIKFASTEDEWSQAITESLTPEMLSDEIVAKRRSIARAHDWDSLVDKVAALMCRQLGKDYTERFASLAIAAE